MTRRRLLCGLLQLLAVLACGAGVLWIVNAQNVTRARLDQVKKGMSREEVIRTVGGPPDSILGERQSWLSQDRGSLLIVVFDDAETAVEVFVLHSELGEPPLSERIRRWLDLF